ncbi:hypothetical protein [Tautonia sociabilis]|uniref:Uncharacterized protein n=1 Tax=Tautonia sociabilis TaxID=2080755 RepID=A0A432MDG0_9BACT|nr:hypothetical protein [Tautonia sociabilis]RUL82215.1 hypothetical protein TsocGM_23810 [Tautonia sociabilis]
MSGGISQKRIEANRRNAQRSTGPRTDEGKARSRANGLRHGMAAEVLVPEEDRVAYEQVLERWRREAGPDNVVEEHLIQRAAVLSVRLDRIERANQEAREAAAREAVARWYRRKQAAARKMGQRLMLDPVNVIEELEATAFGCDWLIRHWRRLDSQIRLGSRWDGRDRAQAMAMFGLPGGPPGPDAGEDAKTLWTLAVSVGYAEPSAFGASALRVASSEAENAPAQTDPDAIRAALRAVIARQIERLRALRDASWREVEGPERAAVARLAAAADTSQEGQLRHRYESSADRACMAAIRLFLNLRDRRRRELLAIAREAAEIGETPRAPVGGGWWREVDSDPEPPGFVRIGADSAVEGGEEASPVPQRETEASAAGGAPSGEVEEASEPGRIPSPPVGAGQAAPDSIRTERRTDPGVPNDGAKPTRPRDEGAVRDATPWKERRLRGCSFAPIPDWGARAGSPPRADRRVLEGRRAEG